MSRRALDLKLSNAAFSSSSNNNIASTSSAASALDSSNHQQERFATVLLEKDVFACSELERAAYCLASAAEALRSLHAFLQSGECV